MRGGKRWDETRDPPIEDPLRRYPRGWETKYQPNPVTLRYRSFVSHTLLSLTLKRRRVGRNNPVSERH